MDALNGQQSVLAETRITEFQTVLTTTFSLTIDSSVIVTGELLIIIITNDIKSESN